MKYVKFVLLVFLSVNVLQAEVSLGNKIKDYWRVASEYSIEKWQNISQWFKDTYEKIVHPSPTPPQTAPEKQQNTDTTR
ncbi:MAG: hypothetical protein WA432_00075 [Candidatus Babeliaceae bacterium]